MDRFEEAVMHCLIANGETFVAPQFNIGSGWSCPDFVAIRHRRGPCTSWRLQFPAMRQALSRKSISAQLNGSLNYVNASRTSKS